MKAVGINTGWVDVAKKLLRKIILRKDGNTPSRALWYPQSQMCEIIINVDSSNVRNAMTNEVALQAIILHEYRHVWQRTDSVWSELQRAKNVSIERDAYDAQFEFERKMDIPVDRDSFRPYFETIDIGDFSLLEQNRLQGPLLNTWGLNIITHTPQELQQLQKCLKEFVLWHLSYGKKERNYTSSHNWRLVDDLTSDQRRIAQYVIDNLKTLQR